MAIHAKNLEAFERIIKFMKEQGIGYGSINHPVDRDPVCGYTGVIGEVCPRCGRREGEAVSIEKTERVKERNILMFRCTDPASGR